ncbi:MAG: TIGR04255 family protein [Betaproteobacteria bacterium]|nr:TIGR04255 family protein [Betaproteobacteria bacterium]
MSAATGTSAASGISGAPSRRIYNRAPIVEAVIDIQVRYPDHLEFPVVTECADAFAAKFARREPLQFFTVGLKNEDGHIESMPSTQGQTGWKLFTAENDRILQIQRKSFTYSHLPPYTRWEIFKQEAMPLWAKFVELCKPEQITRVAVRYINRLMLPAGPIDLSHYLRVVPEVPDSVGPISGVFMQILIPQPSLGPNVHSTVSVASQASPDPRSQAFVLDIDVFQTGVELSSGDATIWTLLDGLRDKKNELFETCLTDKMRELIA